MAHCVEDRSWVTEFYDSAVDWWGDSWYEGENLRPRLEQVEHFVGKAPKLAGSRSGAIPRQTCYFSLKALASGSSTPSLLEKHLILNQHRFRPRVLCMNLTVILLTRSYWPIRSLILFHRKTQVSNK